MDWEDEFRTLRERLANLREKVDQLMDDQADGSRVMLAQLVNGGAFPTAAPTAGIYYLANPIRVTGTEAVGSPPIPTVNADARIAVAVFAPTPMHVGDYVLAKRVPGARWAADVPGTCSSAAGNRLTFGGVGCGLTGTITYTLTDDLGNVIGSCVSPPTNWIDGVHPGHYTVTAVSSIGAPTASTTFTYVTPCAGRNVVVPIGCLSLPTTLTYTGGLPFVPGFSSPDFNAVFVYQSTPADLLGDGNDGSGGCSNMPANIWVTEARPRPGLSDVRYLLFFLGCTAFVYQVFLAGPGPTWVLGPSITLGTIGAPTTATRTATCYPFLMSDTLHASFPFTYSMSGDPTIDPVPFPTTGTIGQPFSCPP